MIRVVAFILICLPVAGYSLPVDSYHTKYDHHFKKSAKRYFGVGTEWRWFKAQGVAESTLRPNAKSWVGAKGVMQIMPATWGEIRRQTGIKSSVTNVKWNIAGGVYYDRQQYKRWIKKTKSELERFSFMFAGYNAGFGNARKASRRCGCIIWAKAARFAPNETRGYVSKIFRLMDSS